MPGWPGATCLEPGFTDMRDVLTILTLSFIISCVWPGYSATQTVSVGATLGVNMTTFGGRDLLLGNSDPERRRGRGAGGVLRYHVTDIVRFQHDVQYMEKGALYRQSPMDVPVKTTFNLQYLETAFMIGLVMREAVDNFRPWLAGGLTASRLTDCVISVVSGPSAPDYSCDDPEMDLTTADHDYGLALGLGADVDPGYGMMTFEIRVGHGLRTIHAPESGEDRRNRELLFRAGYLLFLN